jgi:ferrochelatase
MAYGAPATEADIALYFTHIRGGRPPSDEALEELTQRYQAIDGSPLIEITRTQAGALGEKLKLPAFVGMKHSPPFIEEGAGEARRAGVQRLIGLPLVPHYARMSLGGYESALREAWDGELVFINGFHDNPRFISAVCTLLREALEKGPVERVFFTAHSLPDRILREGDPYQEQLLQSCRLVAREMQLPPWELAYQSQSRTGEPWLGPDVLDAIENSGAKRVLVCPIGFVSDHLEILYDLDVEAQEFARAHNLEIRRTASFNDRPEFIEALADVVQKTLAREGSPQVGS